MSVRIIGEFRDGRLIEKSDGEFKRGTTARAARDVYARGIEKKGGSKVKNPYAVATAMVKKGAKPASKETKKDIKKEKAEQTRMAKHSKEHMADPKYWEDTCETCHALATMPGTEQEDELGDTTSTQLVISGRRR